MKKTLMTVAVLLTGIMLLGQVSFAEELGLKGQTLCARSNLKAKGRTVYFHNMTKEKDVIPVGSEATIVSTGNRTIKFKVPGSDKTYRLTDQPAVYAKYFVKDKSELGLDKLSPQMKQTIDNMEVNEGMTKDEVLMSKGCPAYIGYGIKSWGHTLGELMASNTWYYNQDTKKRDMIVSFEDDKVTNIERR